MTGWIPAYEDPKQSILAHTIHHSLLKFPIRTKIGHDSATKTLGPVTMALRKTPTTKLLKHCCNITIRRMRDRMRLKFNFFQCSCHKKDVQKGSPPPKELFRTCRKPHKFGGVTRSWWIWSPGAHSFDLIVGFHHTLFPMIMFRVRSLESCMR